MGISGWELAAIVQTPLFVQSSFTTYALKLLMFFQRRIIPGHHKMIKNYLKTQKLLDKQTDKYSSYSSTLPANYHSKMQEPKIQKGYYNHTLKRYVFDEDCLEDIDEEDDHDDVIHDEEGAAVVAAARGRRGGHIGVPNGFIPGQSRTLGGPPAYDDVSTHSMGKR